MRTSDFRTFVRARLLEPTVALSLITCLGYFGTARFLYNFYPFSIFPMYQSAGAELAGSRILARDNGGVVAEVSDFVRWQCPPIRTDGELAMEMREDAKAMDYVQQHADGDGVVQPVEVIRRVWRFEPSGKHTVEDLRLGRCQAAHR